MPGRSGLDVARELVEIRADLCIVLVSGYVIDELADSARSFGIRHVIYKANTVKELCESVHRVLDGQRAS
jgi:two-component system cell cycle sensor histidine kinase/response regulator CckA